MLRAHGRVVGFLKWVGGKPGLGLIWNQLDGARERRGGTVADLTRKKRGVSASSISLTTYLAFCL